MKKILIFYASYGGGHLSAANSIKQYIEQNYKNCKVEMIDCMKYINTGIEKITTDSYKMMAKNMPWAWGEIYKLSNKGPVAHISKVSNKIMSVKLIKLFKEYKPDIVISTHPFSTQMTAELKKYKVTECILATIMTDFAPHNQWLVGHKYIDYIFVSHEGMKREISKKDIPGEKVIATGIPLSNRFLKHYDKEKIKKSFKLDVNKKTILFFGGGEFGLGKDKTINILKAFIKNISTKYQIVVISGKNQKMQENFNIIVKQEHVEEDVKVLGYTNKVPELMSISDLVVTKPGGLTITESLASGLPIIAISPIPGQEEENAEFLEDAGIAIWIRKKQNEEEIVKKLLEDEEKLKHMKIRAKLMAKKNSCKNICETILGKTTK